jgi:hypothetical protein
LVLISVCLLLLSTAFLRGGHPPGSGIVNLIILAAAYPLALVGSVAGLTLPPSRAPASAKAFYVLTGVCLCFALAVTVAMILKFGFGKPI